MDATKHLRLFALLLLAILAAPSAHAADRADDPHIRPLLNGIDQFVAEGVSRSPTIRALVDRLEHSDVVVYIRVRPFASSLTRGHLIFMAGTPERRYVLIEIACGEAWSSQLEMLGHELRHAVEIANAPLIRSEAEMAEHYAKIGVRWDRDPRHESFETVAATDAARQVAGELAGDGTRVQQAARNVHQ